jgi:hypothetical protein
MRQQLKVLSANGSTLWGAMKLGVARPIYTRRRDAVDLGIGTHGEVDDFGERAGITAPPHSHNRATPADQQPSFSILPRR